MSFSTPIAALGPWRYLDTMLNVEVEDSHLRCILQAEISQVRAAVEAKHAQERDGLCAEITRLLKGEPETEVLQAVLDAVAGTLDPHSQIADHPNVKFVQMEMLKLRGRS